MTIMVEQIKTSELRKFRKKSTELPSVNYLPLMRNHTLNTIKNNLNASEHFARIPEANSNENNSALYASLTENTASFLTDLNAAVPADEAVRAITLNKDPRVAKMWLSNNALPIPTDQTKPTGDSIHKYMNAPHDLSVPKIPPKGNAYEIHNGNKNASHNSPTEYQARVNYQRPQPLMNFPSGNLYSRSIHGHPLNQHHFNPRLPSSHFMYNVGMTCNCQRLASANPHLMQANPHTVPCNVYGQYSTNSIPHAAHRRDTAVHLAEMHKQACLQRNSYRMEATRTETTQTKTETTQVVSSDHAKQKPETKTTNKRTYTKISKNKTQVIMKNSPPSYNANGNAAVNTPSSNAIENVRKKVVRRNTNASKVKATVPVNNQVHALSNIEIQQTRNSIDIPSTATSQCTQPSINNIPDVIQSPLNTDIHLPPTTMTTNATTNISTVSHYIDIVDEIQAPIMDVDSNRAPPLMNPDLATINHNKEEQIPSFMDQQGDSFKQAPHNNINKLDASTLLDDDNDRAQIDVTASPKILTHSSSNAYGVNLTTSTTTKEMSHNIERNEVLTSNTVNTETGSILDVERTSSILNTVDYRTETRVTTVEVVNHISNISVETLKDILNKVQQMPTKTAAIVNQAHDNQVNKCDDTVNYNVDTNKIIAYTTTDDCIQARIDHKPQEIVSKHDEELERARINLSKMRAIGHKVISVSNEGSFVEEKQSQIKCSTKQIGTSSTKTISHCQIKQETEILEEKPSIDKNREINEAIETREIIKHETCDKSNESIDETLFFIFQIKFFRLVQERLSEKNCQELADQLSEDIYDLIAISDDEGAKADMKYKCHMCRNKAIYSPRSLYYEVTNDQENSLDKALKCPFCVTFRKKYVDTLIKYIERAPKRTHSADNPNTSTDVRQSEPLQDIRKTTQDNKTNGFVVKLPLHRLKEPTVKALMQFSKNKSDSTNKSYRENATLHIATVEDSSQVYNSGNYDPRNNMNAEIITTTNAELNNRNVNNSTKNNVKERLEVGSIIDSTINNGNNGVNPRKIMKSFSTQDATGTNTRGQNRNTISGANKDEHNGEKGKSVKYKCTFCHKDVAGIYKHYGNIHHIEYPEQLLFNNGNVLVRADLDTNGGRAPWFLREKEKAKTRYTHNKCRLCEIPFNNTNWLENHYISEHKVEANILERSNNLRCLFRAEKGAHLFDLPASRAAKRQHRNPPQSARPVSKTGRKNNEEKEAVIEEDSAGLITYSKSHKIMMSFSAQDVTGTNTEEQNRNTISGADNNEHDGINQKPPSKIRRSISATSTLRNAPQVTAAVMEKDYAIRSYEKPQNNEKILNDDKNDDANDRKKVTSQNLEESSDKANQTVEKSLDDSFKSLKANCNSKELPLVNIPGKMQNKNKSKQHKPNEDMKKQNKSTKCEPDEEIKYKFRCKECTVVFKYHLACTSHMKNNHKIQNPVVPRNCIFMKCAFCELYIMVKLYNTHVRTVHSDIFFQKLS